MRYILRACIPRENTDKYVDELIVACKYSNIDEIMMCEDNIFITAIPQPLSAHREMADIMKNAVKKFKESGIKTSFYLKSLVGHFTSKAYVLPYEMFVGLNGERSTSEPCLLDKGFAEYAATLMSYYAECEFDSMMIDDDFRSMNHCGQYGCACDLHVLKTSLRYGKKLTQSDLISAIKSYDKESLKIKKCFREITFEGQLFFAHGIEKAVHSVDPIVQLGLMASGVECDQYQGRDMKKLLRAFAGEGRVPFIRPPGGAYTNTPGDALFNGMDYGVKYRTKLGDDIRYVSEVDVFAPRNIFTKSVKLLDVQCSMHAIAGFDELSLNIIDHFGTSPMESIEYLDMLKENKGKYDKFNAQVKGKRLCGIGLPLPNDYLEKLDNGRFGLLGAHEYQSLLHKLGLPVCFEEFDVNFLTGEHFNCYSDEKLKELFSKGVILDEEGVRAATERGFSKYVGASVVERASQACFERLADVEENSGHAGLRYPVYTGSVHSDERIYKLNAMPGATVLTELADAKLNKIADASTYFENELGGRVLALGTKFTGANLLYKGRIKQLHAVVKKLFFGKLPFVIDNAITIAPFWYKDNDSDILFLYNFGFDKQRFLLRTDRKDIEIEIEPLSIKEFIL